MKKFLLSKRRGFAVPLTTVVIMLLYALGIALLSLGLKTRIYAMRMSSDITARSAADAGLTIALYEMNQKLETEPWDDSSLPQATNISLAGCDNEICSYTVTNDLNGDYTITSTGGASQMTRGVRATIELQGLFEHAILTRASLILKSGTLVDGYNSLDPLDTDADVDIGTQSTADSSIVLNSGVAVDGDVIVGMGGNPDTVIKDLGATTTGSHFAGTEQDPLPRIDAPGDLLDMLTDISVTGATTTLTPADNGRYSWISIKNGTLPGVLEISGGDVVLHIAGDIQLGQSCEIVIKDGSSLTLYVDGDIHCRESSGINPELATQPASTLHIYGTNECSQTFDLKAKSEWTGVVYAPNANVNLYANGDAYGAIVANNFEFKSGGNYHYDEALRNIDEDDEGVHFVIKRWEEFFANL
jgi:hypothetical protein